MICKSTSRNGVSLVLSLSNVGGFSNGSGRRHTRGKGLLKLLGLVAVLEDQRVELLGASDLELGLRRPGGLLDPGGCSQRKCQNPIAPKYRFISAGCPHTLGVLSPADLDEL